jgi:hypothetical protein
MGIDIYAEWREQTDSERAAQVSEWLSTNSGEVGYLREAYHGEPYATRFLFAEAFDSETGSARIPAAQLRENLEKALELVEERARKIYDATDEEVEEEKQSFRNFVALCERVEKETGEAVRIIASY